MPHLLSSDDLSTEQQAALIERAIRLKAQTGSGSGEAKGLSGRSIGMIFEKPSTRTRVSFEVAIAELGGHAVVLRSEELQLGRGETIEDTGRVLSRYLDGLVVRTFGQERLEQLAAVATIPVINALSDAEHPCQALADVMTIVERFGNAGGVTVAWLGDGNNVCHSLMLAGAKAGVDLRVATPEGYQPSASVVGRAGAIAKDTGASLSVDTDPQVAAEGAQVVYTDVWTSMGQEADADQRRAAFEGFRVDSRLMALASDDAIVLHCLPAHRGEEISAEVLDGPASAVWDQAENRLHAQKALLEMLIGGTG